ncbi:MAG TPA: DNA mismatch repair endonuclease MutL [Bacteroidota bacterium]|nr:DNA mismatch repair endonuclease MutL [Bacteroidota bacterium]
MSATINILPTSLANKIAAGEVVQRPESVVKELLENSIDAKATTLSVTIKDGGKTLIQISDNGVGMNEEDASLAFLRHATSKIVTYDDLECIRTLGFRGEALASIASVAQVELKTRRRDDEAGTLVRIADGVIQEQTKTGMNPGTVISVRNLFYNTPARRHFLKSNSTEFKHIYDVIQRIALSYPDIAIEFVSDGDSILELPPGTMDERLKNLFGERHFETLIPVNEHTELIEVSGYIGKPNFARKSRAEQFLFMNGRFIISRALNHAIYSGYEHLMEKGNFPFYLLSLALDPYKVDVNVHPSKMEVKFSDEQSIYRIVMAVVRRALGEQEVIPSLEFQQGGTADQTSRDIGLLQHSAFPRFQNFPPISPGSFIGGARRTDPEADRIPFDAETDRRQGGMNPFAPGIDQLFASTGASAQPSGEFAHLPRDQKDADQTGSVAIWQLHNKYILTQIRSGLMIVDQHVAHERILYERAQTRFQNAVPLSQQLLFPHTMSFTPGDYTLAKELIPDLELLGFQLKVFGKNTIVLEGVPPDVKAGSEASILQDIVDEFKNNQNRITLDARDNLAKSFACKAAIKAGDRLNESEMRSLIDQLFATSMPYVCPHGRPVIVKISLSELDRRFMRT